ncbi:MAG: hypothetical protein LBD79_01765 [Treponema sp.]|nr:hypothetical protein [Treponema sp.]
MLKNVLQIKPPEWECPGGLPQGIRNAASAALDADTEHDAENGCTLAHIFRFK